LAQEYPISLICSLLSVSKSAYYSYKKGESYQINPQKEEHQEMIKNTFIVHKRRYGSRRIAAELAEKGFSIGRFQIRNTLKVAGLKALQPKSFVPRTTDSKHGKRNSPNLLLDANGNRLFLATAPNQVWVSDITYLPMEDGTFSYLSVYMDLFSRLIVGWQIDDNMGEGLIISALEKALLKRKPLPGLIAHSDRGGQYVSTRLREIMKKNKISQSMSRKGDSYDNAFAESLFSRFKTELLQEGTFLSLEDARTEVFEYIEMYYNPIRRHSSISNKSPLKFEELFHLNLPKS
jgi:putative transposase